MSSSTAVAAVTRALQLQLGNMTCVDCSVLYGVFTCLKRSGKHRGLGVHVSFVRSITMDSWSEIQLKKMEACGNDNLNLFLGSYGDGYRGQVQHECGLGVS